MSTKKTLEEAAREQELAKLQSLEGSVRNLRSENKRLMKQIGNWNTLTGEFVARAPSLPKPRKPRLTAKPAKRCCRQGPAPARGRLTGVSFSRGAAEKYRNLRGGVPMPAVRWLLTNKAPRYLKWVAGTSSLPLVR